MTAAENMTAVPGEVVAEARLERAIFTAFSRAQRITMGLGEVRVLAKQIFTADVVAGGYSADVGDVIDRLIVLGIVSYSRTDETLTLMDRGKIRAGLT